MKRLLSLLVMLSMLAMSSWAWSYTEGTKKLCPVEGVCVVVPEKAPDFQNFPTRVLGQRNFPNGNALQVLEALNKESTVDVTLLVMKLEGKVFIISMQVIYAPEGFDKAASAEEHVTDKYEDVQFMETGRPSEKLGHVEKFKDFSEFRKFIEGVRI